MEPTFFSWPRCLCFRIKPQAINITENGMSYVGHHCKDIAEFLCLTFAHEINSTACNASCISSWFILVHQWNRVFKEMDTYLGTYLELLVKLVEAVIPDHIWLRDKYSETPKVCWYCRPLSSSSSVWAFGRKFSQHHYMTLCMIQSLICFLF